MAQESDAVDVHEFFDDVLPRVIEARADLFDHGQGRICFIVHGHGAWTIAFGDHGSPTALVAGIDLEADLVASFSGPAFLALLTGSADPSEPKPVVLGNAALLERFGALLIPAARGGLGARLWSH
jgi:hypothetical protein